MAERDERVSIPRFSLGDRVSYVPTDEVLKDWAVQESSPATVIEIKLRMFRQGPEYWNIVYLLVFDTPWPPVERTLSGSPIRELRVEEDSVVPLGVAPTTGEGETDGL